jgi:hypothetical protein
VGLAEIRVELERAGYRGSRLSRRLRATARAQKGLDGVDVGQAGVGHRIVGRQGHGLLEVVDALVHLLVCADQEFAPLEVQAISLGVSGLVAGEAAFFIAAQSVAQRLRDGCRDFAFDFHHVVYRPGVLLAP